MNGVSHDHHHDDDRQEGENKREREEQEKNRREEREAKTGKLETDSQEYFSLSPPTKSKDIFSRLSRYSRRELHPFRPDSNEGRKKKKRRMKRMETGVSLLESYSIVFPCLILLLPSFSFHFSLSLPLFTFVRTSLSSPVLLVLMQNQGKERRTSAGDKKRDHLISSLKTPDMSLTHDT